MRVADCEREPCIWGSSLNEFCRLCRVIEGFKQRRQGIRWAFLMVAPGSSWGMGTQRVPSVCLLDGQLGKWLISYGKAWVWNHKCQLLRWFFSPFPSQFRECYEWLLGSLKNEETGLETSQEANMSCSVWRRVTARSWFLGEVCHNQYFGSKQSSNVCTLFT